MDTRVLVLVVVFVTTVFIQRNSNAEEPKVIVITDVSPAVEEKMLNILRRLAHVSNDGGLEIEIDQADVAELRTHGPNVKAGAQELAPFPEPVKCAADGYWVRVPITCARCGRVHGYKLIYRYRCNKCGKFHLEAKGTYYAT